MKFLGLNLISFFFIFLIALLLFGPRYINGIFKDLYFSWNKCIKIFSSKLFNLKSNDNKTKSETDITCG
ncbi:hypothetical protein BEV13_04615 [Rickettsiella grylli]|uniref:Uncharacterized protein n=1 Tax=Rickettsiella grylli TaxID=59196 RepID=A8PQH2_9COXI|nr:hypothetical protein RICGR_1519 [Rickettsiella grylli]OJA00002.1 hypothetical protein BEV13_04615 [Rickettsiella grylli]